MAHLIRIQYYSAIFEGQANTSSIPIHACIHAANYLISPGHIPPAFMGALKKSRDKLEISFSQELVNFSGCLQQPTGPGQRPVGSYHLTVVC